MKILIVDDSAVVRTVVKQALEGAGYHDLMEAPDGLAALKLAKTPGLGVSLYVLDVNMPQMDGITLVGELRKFDPQTPIVMLTTETDKARMAQAKALGATGWIVKPFNAEKFIEVVRLFARK